MAPPSSEKTSPISSAGSVDPTVLDSVQRKVCFELPIRHPTRLDDIPEEEDIFEECVNNFVKREDDRRWRCKVLGCTKLFISQHFWRKHVANKHSEWLETLKEEKVTVQDSVEMSHEGNDETSSIGSWEDLSQIEAVDAKEDTAEAFTNISLTENSADEISPVETPSAISSLNEKEHPTNKDYNDLFTAAGYGDIELLMSTLERGVDINHPTVKGYTALVIAIYEGQLEVMRILLKNGADFNLRVNRLPPIVHAALSERGPQCIMTLTDCGASLNTTFGKDSWTILHLAAHKGRVAVVDYLMRKMDLEKADLKGRTPLLLAAESGHFQVAECLLAAGADIKARSNNGGNVLTWSSCNDHVQSVKFWLDCGVDVNSRDESGLTALFLASNFGCVETLKLLLNNGADATLASTRPDGFTPVMSAAFNNNVGALTALIEHGCDLKVKNGLDETALDIAIIEGSKEAVQVLLEKSGRGFYHPKDSVSLQMAMAKSHTEIKALSSAASLMYPYAGFKFEVPGEFAWMEWVLNEGGVLVKARAMRKLLHMALEEQNVEMVKALVDHGCDINIHLESGNTPLSYAVQHRNISIIKVLLDAEADPNMQNDEENQDSAFDNAIFDMQDGNDTEIVDLLLATDRCRINQGRDAAGSAFSHVLGKAQSEEWDVGLADDLALRMLRTVKNVDEDRDEGGCTLLHVAVLRERELFVDILLQRGADLEARDKNDFTAFLLACQFAPSMLQPLHDRGANIHAKFKMDAGALAAAGAEGNVEATKFLINLGLNINQMTGKGRTPLACALNWGQEQTALTLIQHGADVHWVTQEKCKTALHLAARNGLGEVAKALLTKDIDVNAKSRNGWTPLHEACFRGNVKIADLLLDAGADIEACGNNKDRPLHIALASEKEDVALLLLRRGADVTARGSKNETTLLCAAEFESTRALQILLDKGLSTEDVDEESFSPLCCSGSRKVTELLLKHGANIDYQDKNGWTALHHAVCNRDFDIAQELLMGGADTNVKTKDDGLDIFNRIDDIEDEWERMTFVRILDKVDVWKRNREETAAEPKCTGEVEDHDVDNDMEMVDRSECVS